MHGVSKYKNQKQDYAPRASLRVHVVEAGTQLRPVPRPAVDAQRQPLFLVRNRAGLRFAVLEAGREPHRRVTSRRPLGSAGQLTVPRNAVLAVLRRVARWRARARVADALRPVRCAGVLEA